MAQQKNNLNNLELENEKKKTEKKNNRPYYNTIILQHNSNMEEKNII